MTEWEAAGLGELPTAWTWDEYIDACRKMTHDGIPGGADVLDGGYNWVNHVRQVYGADVWYDENGHKYTTIIKTPETKMPDIISQKVTYTDGSGKVYTTEQ